jgi:hypothetical protein
VTRRSTCCHHLWGDGFLALQPGLVLVESGLSAVLELTAVVMFGETVLWVKNERRSREGEGGC